MMMGSVLSMGPTAYQELVAETAAQMGVNSAIVEKDIWVCVVLEHIFTDASYGGHFVFKGGTSLSKVYKVIHRFSEDIDLILDWRLLGYGTSDNERTLTRESRTQQDRLNREVNRQAGDFIGHTLVPWLKESLNKISDLTVRQSERDPLAVEIQYPAIYTQRYVQDKTLLEIGPLAAWVPSEERSITPYISEEHPELTGEIRIPVRVTSIERTFWEKATILHQQAHREAGVQPRHARHYYDLYMIAQTEALPRALADLELLRNVVAFKRRYYSSAAARYDLATPGNFRLLPDAGKLRGLRQDYEDMQAMFFGEPPAWQELIDGLRKIEEQINSLKNDGAIFRSQTSSSP